MCAGVRVKKLISFLSALLSWHGNDRLEANASAVIAGDKPVAACFVFKLPA